MKLISSLAAPSSKVSLSFLILKLATWEVKVSVEIVAARKTRQFFSFLKIKKRKPTYKLGRSSAFPIIEFNSQLLPRSKLSGFMLPTELHEEKQRNSVRIRKPDNFFIRLHGKFDLIKS